MHKGLICIDFAFRQRESFFVAWKKKQNASFFLKNQANGTKTSMAALPWLSRRKISKLFLWPILVLMIFHLNRSHRLSFSFLVCFPSHYGKPLQIWIIWFVQSTKKDFFLAQLNWQSHWECKSIDKCSFSFALFSSFDLTNTISWGVWKILFCLFGSLVCCNGFDTILDGFQQITQHLTNRAVLVLSLVFIRHCMQCD